MRAPVLLAFVAGLTLTAPASLTPQAPSPVSSSLAAQERAGTDAGLDGEVRPGLTDRVAFVVADVVTRVERLDRELSAVADRVRYAEVEIAEPYYGGVGEDAVRIAAAVAGRPVGGSLDEDTARQLVARAEDAMAPTLALAGIDTDTLSRHGLVAAAERLGIDVGDAPFDPTALAQLRAVSDDRLAPAVMALGRDPGRRVSRNDLGPVLADMGLDPATLDGDTLARVVAEARFRLAPVAYASGLSSDELVSRSGLSRALTRLGVAYGDHVDVNDLAAGARAASARITVTPPRALGASLTFQRLYLRSTDGPVAGHLLRWRTGADGGVDVSTSFAGSFATRSSIPAAAARRPDAAAVVNGGYWARGGDPDGLMVTDGRLLSSPETLRDWVRGTRAGFGITADGRAVVGTPEVAVAVELPSGRLAVDGVDRPLGSDEAVLYTHSQFLRRLPSDAVSVVTPGPGSLLRPSSSPFQMTVGGPVATVPSKRLVLVATGSKAAALRAAQGRRASLEIEVGEAWQGVEDALSGGPWLLRDAQVPDVEEWRTEGFGAGHTDRRHPRTAIGFDGAGNAMVLTVDGRQPGYSVGMTHRQMGELMATLGARDAVMLDGGGSSQMVVDGELANRPCCDRRTRPVATAVYLTPTARRG